MGPLKGIRVIEMAGIGPAPFCGMILADMGAEVISVDRISAAGRGSVNEISNRGKKSISLDYNNLLLLSQLILPCLLGPLLLVS